MSHLCNKICGCSSRKAEFQLSTVTVSNETISTNVTTGAESPTMPTDDHSQTPPRAPAPTSNWLSKYGGMLFALCASMCFSLTFLDIKILQKRGFPPFGTSLLFNTGVILPAGIIIAFNDLGFSCGRGRAESDSKRRKILSEIWPLSDNDKRNVLKILTLQGMLQAASVVFRASSLQYLDVGDMTVIVFSSPILTTIIAHFVVQEPCGIIFVFIAIYTFCGVVLITKPPFLFGAKEFDSDHLLGVALASGALICLSMKFVVTRKIHKANVFLMTLFLGTAGFIVSFLLHVTFEDSASIVPKNWTELLLVLGLFGAFCSIASINKALKMENAGPVALVRSLDVLFAFLLQYLFLNVVPDLLSSAGAIIVVSGVLAVGFRKCLISTK